MKSTNFETYLCSNLNITQQESSSIIKNCKTKTISKDQFLLRENEHCKQTFFVEQGLLRMFSLDKKGKEHILTFASENWFLTDRESSYFNQPSAYYIQALEDSQAVMIDEDFIQSLSKEIPNFTDFNNRLLHNHIRHLQNRIHLLLSATAKDRY
ncbi:MAG: cyclic nucleotide-binding domain-containing protein, partial [Bacteroidetes bacterium]|nr:cyclic nucleotide-binding domain-containing protein [Bacteroidota bacterium]